ncbi:M48 family metallopeptidase [Entomohabitans teleogrylli]|uniref:M48 family metallopeptidase n=1 Tax=Entomohabitans teleogrylli TaxID=1384589 RepID=UPI00073D1A69|nr:M48 family metallopeptidase [Entomohabitans teleogrylli]
MVCEGYYQPPGRAQRVAASLRPGTTLVLHTDDGERLFALEDITVSDALGTIPLFITFPDGGRFVPAEDASFRAWYFSQRRPGLVHRLERHKFGVIIALLISLFCGAFWYYGALPWLSQTIARSVPAAAEQRIGEYALWLLEKDSGFRASALPEERQRALGALFRQTLPAEMRQDPTPVKLRLMRIPQGANAFMLPDGTLVMSDQLVALAKSDDALAAVMLHEMGHHHHRHGMQMLVRSSLVTLLMMWAMGDVSGIGDTLLQSAAFLDQMQFSRDMEREADRFAVAGMRAQQRSLAAMIEVYQALEQSAAKEEAVSDESWSWVSTHPAMSERLKMLRAEAAR